MKSITIQSENPAGSPRVESIDKPQEEYDRFADLTGKLIQVSKDELDEQRKAET